ncbi:MAG: Gfo/Idh/MocA family oxidoreductase [Odoribacteraceae bacterium]|jgi:predicted dehydrogenase|nr:Gfo/Idh/MocA family oxidoreductase [Odoribacteraceae bacterium]
MNNLEQSRRDFLKKAGLSLAALTIVPRAVLGGRFLAPSDQLTKAIIGVGVMGQSHISYPGARLTAICDADKKHLDETLRHCPPGVKVYRDYREVLADPSIDIVHIATPPHWHGKMAVDAARAGKDIWCEKPMTRTIGEGLKVKEAVERHGRVFRLNTWFRFTDTFYGMGTTVKPIKKLVESGLLGWPLKVTVNAATGYDWKFYWIGKTGLPVEPVPAELDYDMWLGPAPFKPYNSHRVHSTFRGYWDYDGGGLGDMGQHYLDPIQYFLGKDETSPVEVIVDGEQQDSDACGTWKRVELVYADGCSIVLDGENRDTGAAFIEGPNGKLFPGFHSTIPDLQRKLADFPEPAAQLTDFEKSVRTREPFALNERNGFRSSTLVNLAIIAVRLGRSLKFDPDNLRFIDDEGANRLIDQPARAPWAI